MEPQLPTWHIDPNGVIGELERRERLLIIDDHGGDPRPQLERARQLVHAAAGRLDPAVEARLLHQLLRHAAEASLDRRSCLYRWPFAAQQQLIELLTEGLLALLDGRLDEAQTALARFAEQHRVGAAVVAGPFPGCVLCPVRCQLRHDVAPIAARPALRRDMLHLLKAADDLARVGPELWGIMEQALTQHAGPLAGGLQRRAALCLCAQLVNRLGFSRYTQQLLTRQLVAADDAGAVAPPAGVPD